MNLEIITQTERTFEMGAIIVAILLIPIAISLSLYALALLEIFFKLQEEGTGSAFVKGETLDGIIGAWKGWYPNRPGYPGYDSSKPRNEILECDPENPPDYYNFWFLNFLVKKFGIYYIGPWPFKKVYWYTFEWTEAEQKEGQGWVDRARKEPTNFIYLKGFTYRFTLKAAEENTNKPVDLKFALTIRCNNPEKALFRIVGWLNRLSADASAKARAYVGARSYDQLRSLVSSGSDVSLGTEGAIEFAKEMMSINNTLPSQTNGAPAEYGITVIGADLIEVELTGSNSIELAKATQAMGIAKAYAAAKVETAKGNSEANKVEAKGLARLYREFDKHPQATNYQKWRAVSDAAGKGATIVVSDGANPPVLVSPPQNPGAQAPNQST